MSTQFWNKLLTSTAAACIVFWMSAVLGLYESSVTILHFLLKLSNSSWQEGSSFSRYNPLSSDKSYPGLSILSGMSGPITLHAHNRSCDSVALTCASWFVDWIPSLVPSPKTENTPSMCMVSHKWHDGITRTTLLSTAHWLLSVSKWWCVSVNKVLSWAMA